MMIIQHMKPATLIQYLTI